MVPKGRRGSPKEGACRELREHGDRGKGALVWLDCGGLGSWLGGLLKLRGRRLETGEAPGPRLWVLVGEVRPAARERWR